MPTIDLIDETFVVAAPDVVAAAVHDTARTRAWWPDLELTVFQDRAADGLRWTVTGALVGTAEIWLQPFGDGTVVHVFLRCEVTRRGSATEVAQVSRRRADRLRRDRAWQIKGWSWALKRELEAGRAAGEQRPH
ncbi:MAG TPA: polyketide cyclase / dehydrase and lipid transport [Mycobacteriales bacterium]